LVIQINNHYISCVIERTCKTYVLVCTSPNGKKPVITQFFKNPFQHETFNCKT